jgi:hypothetical protein
MKLIRTKTLPQGLLGQAIDYGLKRWHALNRFVEDGSLEIDNNLIENLTQSFGLHSLCRDANNAENTPGRIEMLKLGMANKFVELGIMLTPDRGLILRCHVGADCATGLLATISLRRCL